MIGKKRLIILVAGVVCGLLLVGGGALAMSSANFAINWSVIGGGGGAASGNYSAEGTIGQPAAESLSITDYQLTSGYWFVLPYAADYSINWDVIAGGGGPASSDSYDARGTVGQPAAEDWSSGDYQLTSGYWYRVGVTQTVATATGTGSATFAVDSGFLTCLAAVAQSGLDCSSAIGLNFPHGFFSFNITNIPPGSTVTITITLPSAVPAGTQYWKCQNGIWVDCTSLLGDNDGDNVLTLVLTDGGPGDADVTANGTIVDPGGPAVVVVAGTVAAPAPTMPEGASTGGEPPVRVTPPDLKPKYLSVNPRQAHPDQPVTILTNVVNRGGMEGSYTVNLMINGQLEQRKTVVVSPGATQPVKFTISKAQPGTYTVAIGGNRARFTVIGADRVGSVGVGSGLVLAVATFVLVVLAGLLLLVVRKRFQAG